MPNWVSNELTIAGPKRPIQKLDTELWDRDRAEKRGDCLRFHVAVPAVPADSDLTPGYPGDGIGENAWGCRAVSSAAPHKRTIIGSTQEWLDSHPFEFYFALEDFLYERTSEPVAFSEPLAPIIDRTVSPWEAPVAIRYRFDTAYGAADRFVEKLARRYPHLYLSLMWQGEEPSVHGIAVHAPQTNAWPVDCQPAIPPEALIEKPPAAEARERAPRPQEHAAASARRLPQMTIPGSTNAVNQER